MTAARKTGLLRFSASRCLALIVKEWHQIGRDPSALVIGVFLPLFMLLVCGFGISMDMKDVPVAIVLEERTPVAQRIAVDFTANPYFDAKVFYAKAPAEKALEAREVECILTIPAGFAANAQQGEAAELVAQAATEGRVCALEFDKFWFVDVYTPNAQNELARIDVRMAWDDAYRDFLSALERETGKPVVTCGDFNVAHEEIDLKNPKSNRGNAGFSDEERGKFTELLDAGFTDTWRAANPDVEGVYSWWSYRFNARKNNAGWRIDYFLVSDAIADNVRDTGIRGDIFGSDHCPVTLTLEL